jgi:hypothetical protein
MAHAAMKTPAYTTRGLEEEMHLVVEVSVRYPKARLSSVNLHGKANCHHQQKSHDEWTTFPNSIRDVSDNDGKDSGCDVDWDGH